MKKTVALLGACAVALPTLLFANSDRIELLYGPYNQLHKLWVDDIEEITVKKTQGITEGYNTVVFKNADGEKEYLMGAINQMQWVPGYKESKLSLEAVPHHRCITLNIDCDDPTINYSFGALPMSRFSGKSEHEYHDIIFDSEKTDILEWVSSSTLANDVTELPTERVFPYSGKQSITWFPSTTEESFAMPGQDYIAYAYQGKIDPETGIVFEHDVIWQKVTMKEVVVEDVDYEISYTVDPSYINMNVKSPNDEPFCVFLVPAANINLENLDAEAAYQISALEQMLYNYGDGDWNSCTYIGEGSERSSQLCSGDEYYILVAGCEFGVMTSHAVVSDKITIPYPDVTDDCTFDVDVEKVSGSVINLNVKPTNPDTHYITFMTDEGKVKEDPIHYYTRTLYTLIRSTFINPTPGEGNPYVFTGDQTLVSNKNCYDGKDMVAGRTYDFYIIGIDDKGTPTTAAKKIQYTAEAAEGFMTFDITFNIDKFKETQLTEKWYRNLEYTVTPSDKDMKYVIYDQKVDSYMASMTDEEFMLDFVDGYKTYLYMYQFTGDHSSGINVGSDFSTGEFGKRWFFVFGYDGSATSDLYLYEIDFATGEMVQLRGPGAE